MRDRFRLPAGFGGQALTRKKIALGVDGLGTRGPLGGPVPELESGHAGHMIATDDIALAPQVPRHLTSTVERRLQELLIDQPHPLPGRACTASSRGSARFSGVSPVGA